MSCSSGSTRKHRYGRYALGSIPQHRPEELKLFPHEATDVEVLVSSWMAAASEHDNCLHMHSIFVGNLTNSLPRIWVFERTSAEVSRLADCFTTSANSGRRSAAAKARRSDTRRASHHEPAPGHWSFDALLRETRMTKSSWA